MLFNQNAIDGSGYVIENSLRFRASASAFLSRTPLTASNRRTWTWSGWVKRGNLGTAQVIFSAGITGNGNTNTQLFFQTDNTLTFQDHNQGVTNFAVYTTTAVFRDPSAWYHIVLSVDSTQATAANRVRIYVNGVQQTLTASVVVSQNYDFQVNNTVIQYIGFGASGYLDGYMAEVNFIDGQALTPSSFGSTNPTTGVWQPERYMGTYGVNGYYLDFSGVTGTSRNYLTYSQLIGGTNWSLNTATASTNSIVAPNGSTTASAITSTGIDGYVLQPVTLVNGNTYTYSVWLKSTTNISIVIIAGTGSPYVSTSCDLTTSWQRFTLTFTTNGTANNIIIGGFNTFSTGEVVHAWGAQLNDGSSADAYFATAAAAQASTLDFGVDYSVNPFGYSSYVSNNLSNTVGATYDAMLDSPTPTGPGTRPIGNYCVLNNIALIGTAATNGSTSNANLTASTAAGSGSGVGATMTVNLPSGNKWYWEVTLVSGVTTAAAACVLGVTENSAPDGLLGTSYVYNSSDTPTYTNGDTISFAYDGVASILYCYKNNVLAKTVTSVSSTRPLIPFIRDNLAGGVVVANFNFGQRPFLYTPPSGYLAMCTSNIPDSVILEGDRYMNATIYAGNGAAGSGTTQTITTAFSPDLLWIKNRTSASGNHVLVDSIRGNNSLSSNNNNPDVPNGNQALLTDGYRVAENGGTGNIAFNPNLTGNNYVGWVWDAGSSTVTNTSGTISSQVRANTTAGISVVTYSGNSVSGATVGHGLGVAPDLVIVKNRTTSNGGTWDWIAKFNGINSLFLNGVNAATATTVSGTVSTVSSTTFTVISGSSSIGQVNITGSNYVAYCFAEIPGFSRIDSYTGNGNADGTFVYCGFRPKFVLIKRTDSTTSANWWMEDSVRNPINPTGLDLIANTAGAETNNTPTFDFLSNGFKMRSTLAGTNASGGTYAFMAFAENPFKNALAR
jgi:hypothetical protein